jgi:uncharacterized protein
MLPTLMTHENADDGRTLTLAGRPRILQWIVLIVLTVGAIAILTRAHLPAALLLGAMIAAMSAAALESEIKVPAIAFILAQGTVGAMVARVLKPSILTEIRSDWLLFFVAVFAVIAASAALGWLLASRRVLPGSTALWGSFPGAATVMSLMAEAYGADVRLVALMQYLRVVCVATTASIVAAIWAHGGGPVAPIEWFPHLDPKAFAETLLLAFGGAMIAPKLRIPAGSLLLPLALGAWLSGAGIITIQLPPWLLAISYAVVGWSIGLRFTRPILVYAARVLPRILLSIIALIVICALFGVVLAKVAHVDMLTAYLATSPGGADSVAIIAASTKVDVPFVMALQTARFVIVLLIGPRLARFVAERTGFAETPHGSKV